MRPDESSLEEYHEMRRLGQEIQATQSEIYLGRQTMQGLRMQQPVDIDAVSAEYVNVREAHHRLHELKQPYTTAKHIVEMYHGIWNWQKPWV
jgi:hypothetical protein